MLTGDLAFTTSDVDFANNAGDDAEAGAGLRVVRKGKGSRRTGAVDLFHDRGFAPIRPSSSNEHI